MQFLTFTLNNVKYGIPIEQVKSIEQHSGIIKLPTTVPYITGIMNLHGNVIPIYNLAKKFGFDNLNLMNIIIVSADDMVVGLEVELVTDITIVEDNQVDNMPTLINSITSYMTNVAHQGHDLTVMVDMNRLISEEEKEAIRKLVHDHEEA